MLSRSGELLLHSPTLSIRKNLLQILLSASSNKSGARNSLVKGWGLSPAPTPSRGSTAPMGTVPSALAPAQEVSPQPLHPPPYQEADGSFSRQGKDGPSQNREGFLLKGPTAGMVPVQLLGMTEPGSVPRDTAQDSSSLTRVQKWESN